MSRIYNYVALPLVFTFEEQFIPEYRYEILSSDLFEKKEIWRKFLSHNEQKQVCCATLLHLFDQQKKVFTSKNRHQNRSICMSYINNLLNLWSTFISGTSAIKTHLWMSLNVFFPRVPCVQRTMNNLEGVELSQCISYLIFTLAYSSFLIHEQYAGLQVLDYCERF